MSCSLETWSIILSGSWHGIQSRCDVLHSPNPPWKERRECERAVRCSREPSEVTRRCSVCPQMTEQRKNKQRLGFLGPPQPNHHHHVPSHWGLAAQSLQDCWRAHTHTHTLTHLSWLTLNLKRRIIMFLLTSCLLFSTSLPLSPSSSTQTSVFSTLVARIKSYSCMNDGPSAARMIWGWNEALSLIFYGAFQDRGRSLQVPSSLSALMCQRAAQTARERERVRWWRSEESLASLSWPWRTLRILPYFSLLLFFSFRWFSWECLWFLTGVLFLLVGHGTPAAWTF